MKLHHYKSLLILLSICLLWSCKKETAVNSVQDEELTQLIDKASEGQGLDFFRLPASDDFANIPQDPNNPVNKEKVALGKLLYHETGLGLNPENEISTGNFSCASCHFASAGFQAGRVQGIGEGGIGFGLNGEGRIKGSLYTESMIDVQPIRSPSALNVAYQEVMLWNGQFGATGMNEGTEHAWTEGTPKAVNHLGYQGIETQAIAGQTVHRMMIDMAFIEDNNYSEYFEKAFPDLPIEESVDIEHAGLAIAAYERTLLANEAPFQKWLAGNSNAMSDLEKEGAILFFGEAKCVNCHTGPALAQMDFHALGLKDLHQIPELTFKTSPDNVENLGRGGFTGVDEDKYKFKVPQLYNLVDSPFLGHGSSMRSVREIIEYKNRGVKENENVPDEYMSPSFQPKGLSDEEITALTAFIEQSLRDPNLRRYEPSSILSGNCFPFNDPMAKNHLGCD